jgi:predicted transcriptional regulator
MEFVVDQLRVLGLSDKEVRVFTALSTFGRMNITDTAKKSGLPRTTVDAMMRRLVEQGLVSRERVGGHYEYVVKLDEVAEKLDWVKRCLQGNTCDVPAREGGAPNRASEQGASLVGVVNGVANAERIDVHEGMHALLEKTFTAHKGDRALMLCSALITEKKRMERFEHCLSHAKNAELHMEILMTTDISEQLSQYAKELLVHLTAYDLRLNFLPASFCIEHTDLLAFRDVVVVVDHHAELTVRIESQRVVDIINHLLRVAREVGWGMDMKMWLEGVLESQNGRTKTE